jgi:predicted O-methyltransferase YrrM
MLYMLIREYSPKKVFEMAPNRGFSSHWILAALHKNDDTSCLHSYDIHNASVGHMSSEYRKRWIFTQGDYEELLRDGRLVMDDFDFIFIDALHTEEFSRGYCTKLLHPHKRKAIVAIHDIVADEHGGGRESAEVYRYMAFASNIKNVFTMSRFMMPTLNSPLPNAVEQVHKIRARHSIVPECSKTLEDCKNAVYNPLYFENNDAPTLFFEIN